MKGYSKDNIKLSYYGEPMFYINEKKRTVTCKLAAFLGGPVEDGAVPFGFEGVNFPPTEISVSSTARCHKDDVFDVEKGKRIALSKAENELYGQASQYVSQVAEKMDFIRTACNSFFTKSVRCQAHNIDYIDSLTMPAHPKYNKNPLPRKRGVEVVHIK